MRSGLPGRRGANVRGHVMAEHPTSYDGVRAEFGVQAAVFATKPATTRYGITRS